MKITTIIKQLLYGKAGSKTFAKLTHTITKKIYNV